ncbi:Arc-like DNA binding domain protein [Photorhabdus australis subsp. thailandensis]|uniref:Arc-like DNA binding domain protein n=1 Tax=Photorhabdus australis subsp. thailandensis TaxID=2805096 RepID=A0A1C0U6K8_9GAMM|nr:Arc family DNA-binding protein [Photorhabdus australis]OCQ53557.1 Arc-like DNA binding domain protein [Photorhabdus australis subsp. thailandensis]
MAKQYSPYPFRMPAEMREEIELKAKESGRSLQQEMLKRIELSLSLENLFAANNPGIEGMYSHVAQLWKTSHVAEGKNTQLETQVANLKDQIKLLTQSTRISDEQKFDLIRRNINSLKDTVQRIEDTLPPLLEPIKVKKHNPNK